MESSEPGCFFVVVSFDAAVNLSHFYFCVCKEDVFVLAIC